MIQWVKSLSRVRLVVTPWTVAYHAPPSMGFSRQEYWSGVPLPSPEVIPSLSHSTVSPSICHEVMGPGRRQWHPTPVLLPGKSRGQRSMVGHSPGGHKESDTTERLHLYFSLSCIGGRNGNPLQCSCLEDPRDSGAWWAALYRVVQSRTRLNRLSRSSNGTRCHDLSFWMLSFKPAFSLSSFTFIKRLLLVLLCFLQ